MPKFEPITKMLVLDEAERELVFNLQKPLYSADQLTEAYEAGKRDAIPEGWALVPKEPTEEMLRAPWLNIDELTSFKLKTSHSYYKAMLAAAPKGEV